jgi:hypothetical protein
MSYFIPFFQLLSPAVIISSLDLAKSISSEVKQSKGPVRDSTQPT